MNLKNIPSINLKLMNFLVLMYPISLITGNMFVNLNIILICILGVLAYKNNLLKLINSKSIIFIFSFFLLLITISIFKQGLISENKNFLKSIFYFRYFIFFLILTLMVKNNHLNFKHLLVLSFVITSLISLDVIFQGLFGKNIIGLESFGKHNSSIFGKELIAGSYIQRFCLMGLVCLPLIYIKQNTKRLILIFLVTIVFFCGVLFSGNRMPSAMLVLSLFLMLFLIKDLRLPIILGLITIAIIFSFLVFKNDNVKKHYAAFYKYSIDTVVNVKKFSTKKYPELEDRRYELFIKEYNKGKDSKKLKSTYELIPFASGHQIVFLTAIDVWRDNLFFGNGLKSFRTTCKTKLHLPNRVCEAHPHNYYLELLNDSGLVGLVIFLLGIIFLLFEKSGNPKKIYENEKTIFLCLVIIIISEFFPFKSSGSFFTTSNSSFVFFLLGLTNGLKNKFFKFN